MIAMHELVVPKSIPKTLAIVLLHSAPLLFGLQAGSLLLAIAMPCTISTSANSSHPILQQLVISFYLINNPSVYKAK
jgi:hypothetical protein